MKLKLLYLLCFLGTFKIAAQVFDVQTLKLSGDNDKRINLVILSEGYQTSEFPKFITDATSFMTALFSQSPFLEYANFFNVYAIKVPSNESGSDHPGTATDVAEPASPLITADTYFNTSYDSYDIHRLLYSANYATISNVLATNFPSYDQALILVNSSVYGGTGGQFPFTSTGTSASEIAIHELGHSLFNLKDEYYPGDALAAEAINMTQETNTSLVKWKNWIGVNNIGIYPYAASGTAASWNRPHQNCKMRNLGVPFCSVCKEGIVEKIHSLVSLIDSYTPTSNSISSPSFPVDFHLNLINPIPNTLKSTWTLNASNFANDVDDVSVLETDLSAGMNTLAVVVNDATTLLKVDNHNSFHVNTVIWTIDNSALGIKNIISEVANYNISMHPNPTNTVVNFKLETDTDTRLKVDILSLDGKKIKTILLTNYQTNQVDISNLSIGLYLTNFYSGNTLIASKKLVKN